MYVRLFAISSLCGLFTGCVLPPAPPENPVTLGEALQTVRQEIIRIQPKPGEPAMGVWLTDIEVILKVDQKRTGNAGLVVGLPDATLVGTKLSMSSTGESGVGNTITIKFKNPLALGKDTVIGNLSAAPQPVKKDDGAAADGGKPGAGNAQNAAPRPAIPPLTPPGGTTWYSGKIPGFKIESNGVLTKE